MNNRKMISGGGVTIPTDLDVIPETLEIAKRWGADAVRDCDGTLFPAELKEAGFKVYATYYTTRKDNDWAKANPDEMQQCYIMTGFYTARGEVVEIPLLEGISGELLAVNTRDDIRRWWEVIDRTAGTVVPAGEWDYLEDGTQVRIRNACRWHEYTVSFLAYLIWDPVHMYNAVVNDWQDVEHQITFDVRQPKTWEYSKQRLSRFLETHPHVDVVRFTTFFHQFTLIFDEWKREKYVDWYGYSASVSPYILEKFEVEAGYSFRPEYIIDQGYYNSQYRIPSREYQDFIKFQHREVTAYAAELVAITHRYGREAMMFLGDHWIGMEPYMEHFPQVGLDAVVGSVGNGSTLRLLSDIPGAGCTEGRFLPYFFPDTFHDGGDPVREAKENWITARRAILRSPIDRIGYGGYLKLAYGFPNFVDYVEQVCDEFRTLSEAVKGCQPYCAKRVAVLNCWGRCRSWGCHMVHHALYQKENYSYAGVVEALSGMAVETAFISFDDIREQPGLLEQYDVVLNIGDAGTAHSGGENWNDPVILTAVRRFIDEGGGFIGVGEPSACPHQGHILQLAAVLGVEQECGFTLGYDKYNWSVKPHFITADSGPEIDFGLAGHRIFAAEQTEVLAVRDREVLLAANSFGGGRAVYVSGLPYSFENARLLYRAIIWSSHGEENLYQWFSSNCHTELHAYIDNGKYCVVNNTGEPQDTTVYTNGGNSFGAALEANEIRWYKI